jgi:hypothetical protein
MSPTNPSPTPIQPQQKAMLGSTPGESALVQQQQNNQNHAALVNATKGGYTKRRRYYKIKGGMTDSERASLSGQMVVPVIKPIYVDQGAGNQTIDSISKSLQSISTQNQANAVYDSQIGSTKTGGKKRTTLKYRLKHNLSSKGRYKKRKNTRRSKKTKRFGKRM